MSCPVSMEALPSGVFEEVFTPDTVRGRVTGNSLTQLSFPKSRSALWDGSPAGETLRLQLCSHRKPRLLLLEKALRLAQRHARHLNKPRLHCFFLGSACVDADEEGVTLTLDRFDPGREQAGAAGRVPSAALPGDVVVPCLFSVQTEASPDQSEVELHHCFKVLQQLVSSRQALDLSQLLKVKGHVFCRPQSDAAAFSLSWSVVCPAIGVDAHPVRPVPIIPTALLRSLTSIARPPPSPLAANRQRGFLTMDQTRKLLLLLESDPKASSLPLVGLWLSGVAHVSNPQVWSWCLRFLFGSALQDRVFTESGCFLLVVFASTHRGPQFFQCRGPRPGPGPGPPQLDCQLLSASQSLTLYQVAPVEGRTLQCELSAEQHSRQTQVFRAAQSSFSSAASLATALSVTDQDSGVEDEDLSPRPSPSPHLPAQQARRVQPSVPELSLLMDSSFTSNHGKRQDVSSTHRRSLAPPPAAVVVHPADRKSYPPTGHAPKPAGAPHQLHSTPNSNLQQPCACCPQAYDCTSIFSSDLRPTAASHQATPPLLSTHQSTPPPPAPSHYAPPPPPAPSYQATPPPSTPSHHAAPSPTAPSHYNTPPPLAPFHQATPPPPAPSYHATPSPLTPSHQTTAPPTAHSHYNTPPPLATFHQVTPPPPAPSYQATPPPSSHPRPQPAAPLAPPTSIHRTPPPTSSPPSTHHPGLPAAPRVSSPPSLHHHPHLGSAPPAQCPCSRPAAVPFYGDSPSPHPVSPPSLPYPPCGSQQQVGAPPDTYQLLLEQDRQLRLLQAQVQMLLEAQGKLQADVQGPRSTASIAVGTGASLFWGNPIQTLPHQEVRTPPPSTLSPASSPTTLPPPASCSPRPSTPSSQELSINRPLPPPASCSPRPPTPSSHELSVNRAVGGAEEGEITGQEAPGSLSSQHSADVPQSPVLGESASMYGPACEQQSFYQNLMIQLNSRLQESDCQQEEEEEEEPVGRRRSLSEVSDASRSSGRKRQSCEGDPVVGATLRRLQQLGVHLDKEDVIESDRRLLAVVESSSTLACINPAAVMSRLSVSDPTASALFPGSSADLSLEANAIALRYLSDSQLSRLSVGVSAPPSGSASSTASLLSPSNMSLATRKYMRRYGLIEEEDGEEEEEEDVQETSARPPLTEALNVKPLPQSQLIRDLRPKMQLLANSAKENPDKENCSSRRPSLVRAGSRQPEGSVGNILDLSRLRQLPKLF